MSQRYFFNSQSIPLKYSFPVYILFHVIINKKTIIKWRKNERENISSSGLFDDDDLFRSTCLLK